jgi:hypothetical protein
MILLDTNVLIYAADGQTKLGRWARRTIAAAVSGDGAAVNAISVAEVCVGDAEPDTVADRIRSWGVAVVDVPAAASEVCARAYRAYRLRRKAEAGVAAPATPLPDFFIGAHARVMGWALATADEARFRTCFPEVPLHVP